MRILAAPDKFKGTATSTRIGAAMVRGAREHGAEAASVTLSDGGDGLLEVFGGANRTSTVTGPLGRPVAADWRLDAEGAVIESATASGLVLAGGTSGNDAMAATSAGTGDLLALAVAAGARRVVVGLGGSACTDGGLGALDVLDDATLEAIVSGAVELVVCCDVTTRYRDAARVYGPQKGATPEQVELLTARLDAARQTVLRRFGVDVGAWDGAGAAGGLAGGLAAIGGVLRPGFDVVADRVGLAASIASVDLVLTGEGRLDASSFAGKVVGGVARLAADAGTPVAAIVGSVADDVVPGVETVSLVATYGRTAAYSDVDECVARATSELIGRVSPRRPG